MKSLQGIFFALTTLTMTTVTHADGMNSNSMKGMQMDNMKMEVPAVQVHHGKGVVKSIDTSKGTITIAHEAIASAHWPAMTMGFKATKDMLTSVKPDQHVEFEFTLNGMEATLTKIIGTN